MLLEHDPSPGAPVPYPGVEGGTVGIKKVLVIGSGGAGKSTFAKRLAAKTGLPLLHLDALFWHPGWVETPKDEWLRRIEHLSADET
jgi:adenylate kinase family enzyme